MDTTAELIRNERWFDALARLVMLMREDNVWFQQEEGRSRHDDFGFRRVSQQVEQILWDGGDRVPTDYPLAILDVLDEYLFTRFKSQGVAAFHLSRHEGRELYVCGRLLARPLQHRKAGHLSNWVRRHWVVPRDIGGYRVLLRGVTEALGSPCRALLGRGQVRCYVGDFPDTVSPDWLDASRPLLRAHERRAAALARVHGSRVVLANQHPEGAGNCHGFVRHPGDAEAIRVEPGKRVVTVDIAPLDD